MKKSLVLALFISSIFQLGTSQNLNLVNAEKFDYSEVTYEDNTGFGQGVIICNHTSDLSYFDLDFDPMGIFAGTAFFHNFDDVNYAGTFYADSDVKLLDININENTDHQTILLKISESVDFRTESDDDDLSFVFPELENMIGIINSDNSSQDSFLMSYILSVEESRPKLWSAGDLTLISGSAIEGQLQYVNPDGSIIDITISDGYNQYLIAIDELGNYQWSYVFENSEYVIQGGVISGVLEYNGEILITTNLAVGDGLLLIGKILYLDYDGNEVKDPVEYPWVVINKLDIDDSGSMMMCGIYYGNVGDTNMDLNGGEYYFEENIMESFNGFLLEYLPNGTVAWGQTIEGPEANRANSFDFTDDYIYLTGQVNEGVVFDVDGEDPMVFDNIGTSPLYVSKYKRDGSLEWVDFFESDDGASGSFISVEDDEISLFGYFTSTFDADPDPSDEEIFTNGNPFPLKSFFVADLEEVSVSTTNLAKETTTLSPNPANSVLKTTHSSERIISITSLAGSVVGQYNASSIDVSNLPSGMYIVNTVDNGVFRSQLVSILH